MSRGTVVIIDDDPLVREVLADYLVGAGYEVKAADSAMAAFALLATVSTDLVLLDIAMPGVNGLDALKRIVAAYPRVPVVMLTAYADLDKTAKALRQGAVDYVRKPVNLEDLDQVIRVQMSARDGAGAVLELGAPDAALPPGVRVVPLEDHPV